MPERNARSVSPVRRLPMICALVTAWCWQTRPADAQLPVISLRALSQSFFAPGESYEVSVREGEHLDEVDSLIVSHPGISAQLLTSPPRPFRDEPVPKFGSFRVTVADDVPEGQYELRCRGRFGVSNPRRVVVRKRVEQVGNVGSDPENATPIDVGVLYAGHATPRRVDVYKLSVQQGKSYEVHLIGHCVDSALLGSVAVVDSKQQTLARGVGSERRDARLTFTAGQDGEVHVVVHDALFRGGSSFPYGLLVRSEGLDQPVCPGSMQPQSVSVPEVSARWVDESEEPIRLEVPAAVRAHFDAVRDEDRFLCRLKQGQRVRVEVVSDRLGQPTDVRLAVHQGIVNADGETTWQQLATADDSQNLSDGILQLGSRDPVLEFTPPADADYRIDLIDQDTGNFLGDTQSYRLIVTDLAPSVDLLAYPVYPHKDPGAVRPAGAHLARGDALVIRVFAIRHGHAAPIQVRATELPPGVECPAAWIAANQNHTDLVVTASDEVGDHMLSLGLEGEFTVGETTHRARAKFASMIWQRDGYRADHAAAVVSELFIATSQRDHVPVSIRPKTSEPLTTQANQKVVLPIAVTRRDGGKANIVLRGKHLPPGVKAGDLTIAADKDEVEWTIDVTAATKPGTYTFWAEGETKVKFAVNPQSLERLNRQRDALKTLRADPERKDDHEKLDAEIAAIEKEIETAKKQTAARDFTVFVPMGSVTLRVNGS
jgi:hypothetical protein